MKCATLDFLGLDVTTVLLEIEKAGEVQRGSQWASWRQRRRNTWLWNCAPIWCKHVFQILLRALLVYRHPLSAMLIILQVIHCIEPGIECLIFAFVHGSYFILRPSFITSAATLLRVWEELRILYSLPHATRLMKSRRIMSWTCRTQREITGALSILVWRSEGGGGDHLKV